MLVRTTRRGVIYLDFDMLYSGYVGAGIMQCPSHVLLRQPRTTTWAEELATILQMISAGRYLVVVDSFNGMSGMWPDRDTRLASYSIMLLASLGQHGGTLVVAAAVARKEGDSWDLTPGGRLPDAPLFVLEDAPSPALRRGDGAALVL